MARRRLYRLLAMLVLLGCAALAAAGYGYWPVLHRKGLLATAEQAARAGNLAMADEALKELTREDPNNLRAQFLYAQVLRRQGRAEEADLHLGKAGDLGLPVEEGRRELGLLYAPLNFSLADGALKSVLKSHPDDVEVLKALAEGCARTHRWVEAEEYFARWLVLQPDNLELLLDRGELYVDIERYQAAESDFRRILQLSPGHYRARLLLSHCLLAEAHMTEAEPELQLCRQMRPESPDPLIGLAACAMEREDLEKAHTLLAQALALDRGSLRALNEIGTIQMYRRRYDLAIPLYERLLGLDKNHKQAHLKLAQCLRYVGRLDEAKVHQERYEELDAAEVRRQAAMRRQRY